MTTIALVKEGCGTHFVYDQGELERHLKLGWKKRPDDWKERELEERRQKRLEAAKAEQERLAAEVAELETPAETPKRGRPKKVAAE
jgi:hypothetical protein